MQRGTVVVHVHHHAGMATANAIDADQRELIDDRALQGSTLKHHHRGNPHTQRIEESGRTDNAAQPFSGLSGRRVQTIAKWLTGRPGGLCCDGSGPIIGRRPLAQNQFKLTVPLQRPHHDTAPVRSDHSRLGDPASAARALCRQFLNWSGRWSDTRISGPPCRLSPPIEHAVALRSGETDRRTYAAFPTISAAHQPALRQLVCRFCSRSARGLAFRYTKPLVGATSRLVQPRGSVVRKGLGHG